MRLLGTARRSSSDDRKASRDRPCAEARFRAIGEHVSSNRSAGHEPLVGVDLAKVNVLRHLEPEGACLGVHDLGRRLPGLQPQEIKEALRQLVGEGKVEVAFRSTADGKRFYRPPPRP